MYICVCVCAHSMFVMFVSCIICVPVHLYVHEAGKGKLNTTNQQEKDVMCVPIYSCIRNHSLLLVNQLC